jgi:hypothetical protein
MSKIGEKDEFSIKLAIWAPKNRQNGKKSINETDWEKIVEK